MSSTSCACPNLSFNLLSLFWVSPEGIPKTPAFWVRVYPKRYGIARLSETWSFCVVFFLFVSFLIQWYVYWSSVVDGSTFIAVFLVSTDHRTQYIFAKRLHESIEEKLASIPDHGKLVVSPPGWESISKIPETFHITLKQTRDDYFRRRAVNDSKLFTSFIEIFKKRWPSLDLISMMREFKRTWRNHLEMKDNLSTMPRF